MWNAYRKWTRLKKALIVRGIDPDFIRLDTLATVLERRGVTDAQLNPVVRGIITLLEPPACPMAHCKHYSHSRAPMNCVAGKTPGRCAKLRAFRKRQKERAEAEAEAAK